MKKRVFFLLYSMDIGGVEKSLLGLLSTLDKDEYEVHIGLLRPVGGFLTMLPDWVIVHHCFQGIWKEVNKPPMQTIKEALKKGHLIEALIHVFLYAVYKLTLDKTLFYQYLLRNEPLIEGEFDAAHSYAGPAPMLDYYVCRKLKAKERYTWVHFDVKKNGVDKVMGRRFYKEFNKIYVVSQGAKQNFDSIFPEFKEKTEVRYNVLNPKDVMALASQAPSFDDDFQGQRILTVGRLSQEKGQDMAIHALKMLVDKGYDLRWYFVGDGLFRKECERLAHEMNLDDRVVFLGMQTNPYGYMRDCDVYVQPSHHEGYCITLAEARCFTAPIVATHFTGAEEQLKTYPQSAVIAMTPEGVAEGVEKFLRTLKNLNKL